jgi:hypothetical protein
MPGVSGIWEREREYMSAVEFLQPEQTASYFSDFAFDGPAKLRSMGAEDVLC